jgi:hypothetical protein
VRNFLAEALSMLPLPGLLRSFEGQQQLQQRISELEAEVKSVVEAMSCASSRRRWVKISCAVTCATAYRPSGYATQTSSLRQQLVGARMQPQRARGAEEAAGRRADSTKALAFVPLTAVTTSGAAEQPDSRDRAITYGSSSSSSSSEPATLAAPAAGDALGSADSSRSEGGAGSDSRSTPAAVAREVLQVCASRYWEGASTCLPASYTLILPSKAASS